MRKYKILAAISIVIAVGAFYHYVTRGAGRELTIIVRDFDSGVPLEGVRVSATQAMKSVFAPNSMLHQALEGVTNHAGVVTLREEESIPSAYRLTAGLANYFCFSRYINEGLNEKSEIRLKKVELAEAARTVEVGRYSRSNLDPKPFWSGSDITAAGFSISKGSYVPEGEPADFRVRFKDFKNYAEMDNYARGRSLLGSYAVFEAGEKGSSKLIVALEAAPNGAIQHMPSRQENAFQELDRCNLDRPTSAIELFGNHINLELKNSELFCVRTPGGKYVKLRFQGTRMEWAIQNDGSPYVATGKLSKSALECID